MENFSLYQAHAERMVNSLPGRHKHYYPGYYSERVIDLVDTLPDRIDTVVIFSFDPWYFDRNNHMLDWLADRPRRFYIAHLGYQHQQVRHNVWELSFPLFYFTRSRQPCTIKPQGLPWGFSSLNRRTAAHRLLLGIELWRHGLLSDMIYTQDLMAQQWIQGHASNLVEAHDPDHEFRHLLPIRHDSEMHVRDQIPNDHGIDHDAYQRCYANIVTETEVEHFYFDRLVPTPSITEKSYKPFLSKQIPVFLASAGHLPYLTSLGFETMHHVLPTGFDAKPTLEKITDIRKLVQQGRDWIQHFYHDHVREIEHNHALAMSDHVDNLIFDSIKDFVKHH